MTQVEQEKGRASSEITDELPQSDTELGMNKPAPDQTDADAKKVVTPDSAAKQTEEANLASQESPKKTSGEDTVIEGSDAPSLEEALATIDSQPSLDAQLARTIEYMESALAQPIAPNFRLFWELRKKAMALFKDGITPSVRTQLWGSYTSLTQEARRLKAILDEQTAFAVEQIEIAIGAVEADIEAFATLKEQQETVDFGHSSKAFHPRRSFYEPVQRELNILNALASRINALRKELIKTNMRVRHKNLFFKRLSAVGDSVFPRRKELIKEISSAFLEDIHQFVRTHFSGNELDGPLHVIRAEIKGLQHIAKILTLNTRSFTQTRSLLSDCWEQIKRSEKDRKKERAHKKGIYQENQAEIEQQMEALTKQFEEHELQPRQLVHQLDGLLAKMRDTELGRDEVNHLRTLIDEAKRPAKLQITEEETRKRQEEQEKEDSRKSAVLELFEQINQLLQSHENVKPQEVNERSDDLRLQAKELQMTKEERFELERRLVPLRDLVIELREKALLQLPAEDQAALSELQQALDERQSLRKEIKSRLDECRKAAGASGLDFEQAMQYNERQISEKARLEKADNAIQEIEAKIEELESKL